jgi:hypothetical protein
MATLDDLLDTIFDRRQPPLRAELAAWLRDSRRFLAFVSAHQTKIRAKVKNAADEAAGQDVRAELATAALLLSEERFSLEYEKYAAAKQRGPDFTVTYRTHTPFNVEVRRLRAAEREAGDAPWQNKLMAVLADKVGQMPPSSVNLLWLVAPGELSQADLAAAVARLRQLAESKTEAYFTRRGYASAAAFLRQLRQLSAVVLAQPGQKTTWLNPIARHKAPSEIITAIQRLASLEGRE